MSKKNKVVKLASKNRDRGKSYLVTYNGVEMTRAEREALIRAAQPKPAPEPVGKKVKKGTKVAEPRHSKLFNLLHPNKKQTVAPNLKSVDVKKKKPVEEPVKKEEPVAEEPVVEEEKPVIVPEPVVEEPAPVAEPEPVVEEPAPEPEPEPVVEEPAPEPEPEPVVEEPAPEPEPVVEEPAPVAEPEPVVEEPAPEPEPEPVVEEPAPVAEPEPEPEVVDGDDDFEEEDDDDEEDDLSEALNIHNAKKRISPKFVMRVGKSSAKSCDEYINAEAGLDEKIAAVEAEIKKAKTPKDATEEVKAEFNDKRKALRAEKKKLELEKSTNASKAIALERAADGYCDIFTLLTGKKLRVRKTERLNPYVPLTEEMELEVLNSLWANKSARKAPKKKS